MPYPSRVPWRFRNVRRDFIFWPHLESIEITQSFPDMVSTFSCTVTASTDHPEYDFEPEDEIRVFAGPTGGDATERIFGGHLKTVEETVASEFGPRRWVLTAQDYTAKLGDAIIRERQHRRQERYGRRIRWILSYLGHAWNLAGTDYQIDDNDTIERMDHYGQTVSEALENVANEAGLRYWIDAENVFHAVQDPAFTPPFELNNDDPDFVTSFPFTSYSLTRDTEGLANAVLVEPEKRSESRWASAPGNIADYAWGSSTGRQERFVSNEEIRTARGAQRTAQRAVNRSKVQAYEGQILVHEPGIRAGMTVPMREAVWGRNITMIATDVTITAVDPHDENGEAYLFSQVTLKTKQKRRSPAIGRPEERTANVARYPVATFPNPVAPSAPVPDATFSPTLAHWRLHWTMVGSWSGHVYTPGTPVGPDWAGTIGPPVGGQIRDSLAYQHTTYPYVPCEPFGRGASSGWDEFEYWVAFTVPTKPADVAGMYITVACDEKHGAAIASGVVTRAALTQPSAIRSATVYGTEGTVFLPASVIPAEGETMWIGVTPGWTAQHDYEYYCVSTPTSAADTSGWASQIEVSGFQWAVASGDTNLGTTDAPAGAPWQGEGQIEVVGIEGAPVYGIDGDGLFIEAEEPSGVGISVAGPGEGDDETPTQPFDEPWGVELEFTVDAVGDTGVPGVRSIELTTTGNGTRTVGTVYLGDMNNSAAIGVAGPTSTGQEGVTLTTGEAYRASFDTRAGELVAKFWRVSDGEPAGVAVLGVIDETDDIGDRLTLWLRAGNGAGDPQRITITRIDALAYAPPGAAIAYEWIGFASGVTDKFRTRQRHLMGTLVAHVNGIDSGPIQTDGVEFHLDAFPTAMSGIHASYVVADEAQEEGGEDDDDEEEGS